LPGLAAGESASITVTACVARDYAGLGPVPLQATAVAEGADPDPANNTATAAAVLLRSLFADGFDCG
jgi:hypothetical protein